MKTQRKKSDFEDQRFLVVAKVFYWIATIIMLILFTVPTITLVCNNSNAAGWAAIIAILGILGFGGIPYLVALIGSIVCLTQSSRYSKAIAAKVNLLSGMVVIEAIIAAFLVFLVASGMMSGFWALDVMLMLVVLAVMAIVAPRMILKRMKTGGKSCKAA